ncbi:MAG: primosomal protein N' [candidate division WOR-3 bacterium]
MFCDVVIPRTPLNELTYTFDPEKLGEIFPGDCLSVPLRGRHHLGVVFQVHKNPPAASPLMVQPVTGIAARGVFNQEMLKLLRWVAAYYVTHLGEVLGLAFPRGIRQYLLRHPSSVSPQPPALSPQPSALSGFKVWVFCQNGVIRERTVTDFIEKALARGSVLFLLPEPLIPKWRQLLSGRFGERLVDFYTARGRANREAWFSLAQGRQRLVLGVRAAVFSPVKDLSGVVMINEDWKGYKEKRQPRYNARDVAIHRARLTDCPVLLCERTLTLETYHKIKLGEFHLIGNLPKRSFRENFFVVDMRPHRNELLSPRLLTELRRTLEKGGVALCYINRKGLSRYVLCQDCGEVLKCPTCRLPGIITGDGTLECRYCGSKTPAPDRCPECSGLNFIYRSPGVKMVVKKLLESGLKAVERKEELTKGAVLVGTRGLLSGPLPENIRLFGVINLDTEFTLPDFRTRERAFRLLEDICHRAELSNARVVIQTYRPDERLIECLRNGAIGQFLESELADREEANLPPFCRLVLLEFSGANPKPVSEHSAKVAAWLSKIDGVEVLGPLAKLEKKAVTRLLVKMPLDLLLGEVIDLAQLKKTGLKIRVDVDPLAVV